MIRSGVLAAIAVCGVLLGCSGPSGQGTVSGIVRISGGPSLPGSGQAKTGQPQAGAAVSLASDGHEVASGTTDAQGHFTISVAPGTYEIDGCGSLSPSGETVTIAGGQTTQHDIMCQMP